jgi:hypothetical protein
MPAHINIHTHIYFTLQRIHHRAQTASHNEGVPGATNAGVYPEALDVARLEIAARFETSGAMLSFSAHFFFFF